MLEEVNDDDEENFVSQFKIILLGDSGVGKTTIVSNFLCKRTSFEVQSTKVCDTDTRIFKKDGKRIRI